MKLTIQVEYINKEYIVNCTGVKQEYHGEDLGNTLLELACDLDAAGETVEDEFGKYFGYIFTMFNAKAMDFADLAIDENSEEDKYTQAIDGLEIIKDFISENYNAFLDRHIAKLERQRLLGVPKHLLLVAVDK